MTSRFGWTNGYFVHPHLRPPESKGTGLAFEFRIESIDPDSQNAPVDIKKTEIPSFFVTRSDAPDYLRRACGLERDSVANSIAGSR